MDFFISAVSVTINLIVLYGIAQQSGWWGHSRHCQHHSQQTTSGSHHCHGPSPFWPQAQPSPSKNLHDQHCRPAPFTRQYPALRGRPHLFVNPDGLMYDCLHLTKQGYQQLIEPLSDKVQTILKNFMTADTGSSGNPYLR